MEISYSSWPWHRSDATALAGYANMMMMMMMQLRDVAMATTYWFSMGNNFSCMTASDTLFDSRGGFSGTSYPMKTQPRSRV